MSKSTAHKKPLSQTEKLDRKATRQLWNKALSHLVKKAQKGIYLPTSVTMEGYARIAVDLRRQLDDQLGNRPSSAQQGELFK